MVLSIPGPTHLQLSLGQLRPIFNIISTGNSALTIWDITGALGLSLHNPNELLPTQNLSSLLLLPANCDPLTHMHVCMCTHNIMSLLST